MSKSKLAMILAAIITMISLIPFVSLDKQILWITYFSIPFIILGGSAAVKYVQNTIAKTVMGFAFTAMVIAMIQSLITSK